MPQYFFISKFNPRSTWYNDTSIYSAPRESRLHSSVYKTWQLIHAHINIIIKWLCIRYEKKITTIMYIGCCTKYSSIGLYRDVWIAAIASSRKSLATQTAAILYVFVFMGDGYVTCTSQCRLRSLRANPL